MLNVYFTYSYLLTLKCSVNQSFDPINIYFQYCLAFEIYLSTDNCCTNYVTLNIHYRNY